jgi:DNA-binding transcriptional LysR family regulator
MRDFVRQNPGVSVSLFDGDASSVAHSMHARIADFGLTGFWKEHPDFRFEPLTMDRCCVICPPDHEFADREWIELSELEGVPIISLNGDSGIRRLLDSVCANAGIDLIVRFEVARVSTLLGMVLAGLGISVLTELSTLQDLMPQLRAIPLKGSGLAYPVGIITPANRMLSAAAALFVESLRGQAIVENAR